MRRALSVMFVLSLGLASPALAQMMGGEMPTEGNMPMGSGGMGMGGMGMGGMGMGGMGLGGMGMMGAGLRAACSVDLGALDLPADVRKGLEDERFALQKTVIRKRADLAILRLELSRMIQERGFDLAAAQKNAKDAAEIEADLRAAHLAFLHEMGSKLSDEQWQKLQEQRGRMPMMGGRGMMNCRMHDGGMGNMYREGRGGQMPGGMMMQPGGAMGGPGHHPTSSEEAERFFEKE